MNLTLKTLAEELGLTYSGKAEIGLDHICAIENLDNGGVAFINNPQELGDLPTPSGIFDSRQKSIKGISGQLNGAIIVPHNINNRSLNLIFSDDPITHHIKATGLLYDSPEQSRHVHPDATIGKNVSLGHGVTIDARAVIYNNVTIGDNTIIRAGVI
ncbi:MAG: hypothetical protein HQ517_11745, partial [SAR324 cluster bacterium]|nr:hypothetical protein [SAR324 cluster bacterium]